MGLAETLLDLKLPQQRSLSRRTCEAPTRLSRVGGDNLSSFALCANIDETTASPFITVEGTEVDKDGRSWKRAATLAAAWRL